MYDDSDYGFGFLMISMVLFFTGTILCVVYTTDEDNWTGPVKDCYVHTHSYNHLTGDDTKTSETYCKVEK